MSSIPHVRFSHVIIESRSISKVRARPFFKGRISNLLLVQSSRFRYLLTIQIPSLYWGVPPFVYLHHMTKSRISPTVLMCHQFNSEYVMWLYSVISLFPLFFTMYTWRCNQVTVPVFTASVRFYQGVSPFCPIIVT